MLTVPAAAAEWDANSGQIRRTDMAKRLRYQDVSRITDRPDMTLDVYRGRKTTIQQQQQLGLHVLLILEQWM